MAVRWSGGAVDGANRLVTVGTVCRIPSSCGSGQFIAVARFDPSGRLDTSFNPLGVKPGTLTLTTTGVLDPAGIAVDSQGRYVVAANLGGELIVIRWLSTGAIDATFAPAAAVPGIYRRSFGTAMGVQALAVDATDRIVLVGHTDGVPFVTRLTATGMTDFGFSPGATIPGVFVLDATLAPGFSFGSATSVAVDGNQRLLIAGLQNTQNYFATSAVNHGSGIGNPFVMRLSPTGTLDPAFGSGAWAGIATLAGFSSPGNRYFRGRLGVALDTLDRIVIGGLAFFVSRQGPVAFRLSSNGIEDPTTYTYSPNWPSPVTPFTPVSSLAPQLGTAEFSSGKVGIDATGNVYIGATYSYQFFTSDQDTRPFLFRTKPTLEPDGTFAPDIPGNPPTRGLRPFDITEGPARGNAVLFVPDAARGVAYLASLGRLQDGDGPVLRLLLSDGTLDPSYGDSGVAFSGGAGLGGAQLSDGALVTLADRRPILVGRYSTAENDTANTPGTSLSLVRFTSAGAVDTSIAPNAAPPGLALWAPTLDSKSFYMATAGSTPTLLDSDGKILVGFDGVFKSLGNNVRSAVARFNANGTLDTTFNPGGSIPGLVTNQLGAPTTSMATYALAQDGQKRYYVVGDTHTGPCCNSDVGFVVRLLNDGTLDTSFNDGVNPYVLVRYGSTSNAYARSIALTDGKVLVGGAGGASGGAAVARFLDNGTPDVTFNPTGPSPGALTYSAPLVEGLFVLDDQRVMASHRAVTGDPDFAPYHLFARLTASGAIDGSFNNNLGYLIPDSTCYLHWFLNARLPDGRSYHLCSGFFESFPTGGRSQIVPPVIMRLRADGEKETTFGINGEFVIPSSFASGAILAHGITVDGNGNVVIGGQVITDFTFADSPGIQTYVAKFLPITVDTTPDPFAFAPVLDVPRSTVQTSAPATISGISVPSPISVTGGSYSIDCTGSFVTTAGTILNGQTVCVRHTSSSGYSATVTTTLTVGGVVGTFSSTTIALPDTTPDPFSFDSVNNVPLSSVQTSGAATIGGINAAAPITVTGGSYSIGCTATFITTAATITNGQTVCVRHSSAASYNTTVTTTLTIGGIDGTFSSTTLPAPDTTPDPFTFPSVNNVPPSSVQTSAPATIGGINAPAPISVAGGSYSIGCTATFVTAASTIDNGQTVCVRHTASAAFATTTTTTLNVGGVSGTFSSTTAAAPPIRPRDFNGDGKSDILWRRPEAGDVAMWIMNGLTPSASAIVLGPSSWGVSHIGDLDGDGRADLLWWNYITGHTAAWRMNGTTPIATATLLDDPNWRVEHLADANGDGKRDLVWRNQATGATALWLMNGLAPSATTMLLGDPNWRVTHIGDFDGDGKSDLVWRNTSSGATALWLMNGLAPKATSVVLANPAWRVVHTGDFNGDGKSDLLWRNDSTGEVAAWLMNGVATTHAAVLFADAGWMVTHVADWNGDGRSDLLWYQVATGTTAMWLMDALAPSATRVLLVSPDPRWVVSNAEDYNGDGRADLIWAIGGTQQVTMWLMLGTTSIGQAGLISGWAVAPQWQP